MEDDDNHQRHANGLGWGSPESPLIGIKTKSQDHHSNNQDIDNHHNQNVSKEQDRFLPIANVGRIMKKMIPGNGKISKDAKETVQECVSEFISFVTGEASDKCQREKRKTINGDDIIWAITTLGFENYVSPLKVYLEKYREIEGEKLNVPKQQRLQQQITHNHQNDQAAADQTHLLPNFNTLYSPSTNLVMPHHQPSFVAADQPFSALLPHDFSPNSIRKQLQPQDVD